LLIGCDLLDPAGVDFAMKFIHSTWRYHGITAVLLAEQLAGLPAKIDHIEQLADEGVIGAEEGNAADLQIGSTIKVFQSIGDLDGLLDGTAAAAIATRWFGPVEGRIPAGAFPAGWVPDRA
jgi:glutathione S-transferase